MPHRTLSDYAQREPAPEATALTPVPDEERCPELRAVAGVGHVRCTKARSLPSPPWHKGRHSAAGSTWGKARPR